MNAATATTTDEWVRKVRDLHTYITAVAPDVDCQLDSDGLELLLGTAGVRARVGLYGHPMTPRIAVTSTFADSGHSSDTAAGLAAHAIALLRLSTFVSLIAATLEGVTVTA